MSRSPGESGKGKTHAFKKMMRQVPDRYKVKGTVSNKALYYMKDLSAPDGADE